MLTWNNNLNYNNIIFHLVHVKIRQFSLRNIRYHPNLFFLFFKFDLNIRFFSTYINILTKYINKEDIVELAELLINCETFVYIILIFENFHK